MMLGEEAACWTSRRETGDLPLPPALEPVVPPPSPASEPLSETETSPAAAAAAPSPAALSRLDMVEAFHLVTRLKATAGAARLVANFDGDEPGLPKALATGPTEALSLLMRSRSH